MLPLINIVFLMLIFFLVAAQLARPRDPALKLVQTADPATRPPADAVVLDAAGQVSFRGAHSDAGATFTRLSAEGSELRLGAGDPDAVGRGVDAVEHVAGFDAAALGEDPLLDDAADPGPHLGGAGRGNSPGKVGDDGQRLGHHLEHRNRRGRGVCLLGKAGRGGENGRGNDT
ncbi:biopolymer transporter ExbD [Mangrovicoccus ximenensis]